MIFTRLTQVAAWLSVLGGAALLVPGYMITDYSVNSGEAPVMSINLIGDMFTAGAVLIGFGLLVGVLCDISVSLHEAAHSSAGRYSEPELGQQS